MLDRMPDQFIAPIPKTLQTLPVGERAPTLANFLRVREDRTVWLLSNAMINDGNREKWNNIVFITKLVDGTIEADIGATVSNGYRFRLEHTLRDDLRVSRLIVNSEEAGSKVRDLKGDVSEQNG